MENSSIYNDLKKFAGKIEGKKVALMTIEPEIPDYEEEIVKVRKVLTKQKPEITSDTVITIDSVAAMIIAPMVPLRDANGYVHDNSSIAVKCAQGHIHKYFLTDITKTSGSTLKCLTCSSGNKFINMVREIVETTLGVPFILAERKLDTNMYNEYINPVLKISIACNRISGKDSSATVDGILLIKIHNTTSVKKVKESLYDHLVPIIDTLPADSHSRILELKQIKPIKITAFPKEPLPYTPELAELNSFGQMNIITENADKLCLENC